MWNAPGILLKNLFKEHITCTLIEHINAISIVSLRVNILSFKYSGIPRVDGKLLLPERVL